MKTFMINIQLKHSFTEEFMQLIPNQRAHISQLMEKGTVLQYSLNAGRTQLWVIMSAPSEEKVMDMLSSFPLIRYMQPEIQELAFHNSVSNELPKIIMN